MSAPADETFSCWGKLAVEKCEVLSLTLPSALR
jgi:hypothetical protein